MTKETILKNAGIGPDDDEEIITEPAPEPGGDILQE